MKAPEVRVQSTFKTVGQKIMKVGEEIEMGFGKKVINAKNRIGQALATQNPVKLVGILALGAVLMAATGLHFAPRHAEEANNLSENIAPKVFHSGEYDDNMVLNGNRWEIADNEGSSALAREAYILGEYDDGLVYDGSHWVVPGSTSDNIPAREAYILGEYDDGLVFDGSRWVVPGSKDDNNPTRNVFHSGEYDDNLVQTENGWVLKAK